MWRKIRELDFDDLVEQIRRATNPTTRKVGDPIIQSDLAFVTDRAAALRMVRNHIALAALDRTKCIDDIRADAPLVQALVRCQHHPSAQPLPALPVERGLEGPDAAPRLGEIVAAHPEQAWDADTIEKLLVGAIKDGAGDVEVDDELPPWRISFEPMGAAAVALIMFVTLRALGDV